MSFKTRTKYCLIAPLAALLSVVFSADLCLAAPQAPKKPAEASAQARPAATPSSPAVAPGEVAVLDMVLASVEDEPITISDLREYADQQGRQLPANFTNGDPAARQLLRDLVVTKLIEREAAASGISVSDEEVTAYVGEIKRQNHVDDQGLERLLASKGLSYEVYKRQVREDIFKTRVVGMRVRNKITVTDEEVKARLAGSDSSKAEDDGEKSKQPAGVRLFQIRLPKEDRGGAAAKAQAEKMRAQLQAGDNWPKVGSEYFTDLGDIAVSDLRPELAAVVENLKENEISPLVETPDAVYILMTANAEAAKTSTTDTPEDRVRQQLYQEKFTAALDKFLNDELPKKYHVELKL